MKGFSLCHLPEFEHHHDQFPHCYSHEKRPNTLISGPHSSLSQEAQLPSSLGDGGDFIAQQASQGLHSLVIIEQPDYQLRLALDFVDNYILDTPPGKVPHGALRGRSTPTVKQAPRAIPSFEKQGPAFLPLTLSPRCFNSSLAQCPEAGMGLVSAIGSGRGAPCFQELW